MLTWCPSLLCYVTELCESRTPTMAIQSFLLNDIFFLKFYQLIFKDFERPSDLWYCCQLQIKIVLYLNKHLLTDWPTLKFNNELNIINFQTQKLCQNFVVCISYNLLRFFRCFASNMSILLEVKVLTRTIIIVVRHPIRYMILLLMLLDRCLLHSTIYWDCKDKHLRPRYVNLPLLPSQLIFQKFHRMCEGDYPRRLRV